VKSDEPHLTPNEKTQPRMANWCNGACWCTLAQKDTLFVPIAALIFYSHSVKIPFVF
jgi:hypothetical protein